MDFKLKNTCKNCPFRKDSLEGWLGEGRATEIAEGLDNSTFTCHSTINYEGSYFDEEEDKYIYPNSHKESHCVGAIKVLMNEGRVMDNSMLRIAVRLGLFDVEGVKPESVVFESMEEFIKHHK